jgi:hypothetical protein
MSEQVPKFVTVPHQKVQYIKKTRQIAKGKKEKINRGVLFAAINPCDAESVVIGFSVCNMKYDFFDTIHTKMGFSREYGFGKAVALNRAYKWSGYDGCILGTEVKQIIEDKVKEVPELAKKSKADLVQELVGNNKVIVPDSIKDDLVDFVQRCAKYYKGKAFPKWVANLIVNYV